MLDVVVLGGGPAGAATALALARHAPELAVAVVAGSASAVDPPWRVGESLPPAARPLLEGLGVWSSFLDQEHLPSRGTSAVWGPSEGRGGTPPSDHDFLLTPQAEGWHLDRARFDRWLLERAEAAGVAVWRGAVYLGHEERAGGQAPWRLAVRRGGRESELAARWVVDATGRRAAFARREGAAPVVLDDLLAVFRRYAGAGSEAVPSTHALVEAVEDGWWYAARLPGERLVVGVFADADGVAARDLRDAAGWRRALDRTTRIGEWVAATGDAGSPPEAFPADSRHLHPVAGDGWLAVGDAAACYDPLSSQGLLEALRFGRLAAYAAADALGGDAGATAKYASWVKRSFEGFLAARTEVYRREGRWPAAPFWRRRRALSLDPHARLAPGATPLPTPARHLPAPALARLRELCDPPRPAHEVVRAFVGEWPDAPSEQRVIFALQHLAEAGSVEIC